MRSVGAASHCADAGAATPTGQYSRQATTPDRRTAPRPLPRSPGRFASIVMVVVALAYAQPPHAAAPVPLVAPDEINMPSGPAGAAINHGKMLVTDTARMLPQNVGDALTCANCHLGAGTVALAGPFVGLWGMFPQVGERDGVVETLAERINECFERSMNGKPIAHDSAEMNAILLYINWLSTGVPTGTPVVGRGMGRVDSALKPVPARGKQVYAAKCAACHGPDGEGTRNPAGGYSFPPVWGPRSFNAGAGMADTYMAAAFIKHNMPLGQGNTLSDQEAIDVADYVARQPRPAFLAAKNDDAKGAKPMNARVADASTTPQRGAASTTIGTAPPLGAPLSSVAVPAAVQPGDASRGSQKVQMCQGCHGIEGWRTAFPEVYRVPRIAGQQVAYLVVALKEYRSGNRGHPTMRAIAASLSDQDIADVAAYYAQSSLRTMAR
jgi:thiosulfate dehydrogenase